jgi:hypothetical protein
VEFDNNNRIQTEGVGRNLVASSRTDARGVARIGVYGAPQPANLPANSSEVRREFKVRVNIAVEPKSIFSPGYDSFGFINGPNAIVNLIPDLIQSTRWASSKTYSFPVTDYTPREFHVRIEGTIDCCHYADLQTDYQRVTGGETVNFSMQGLLVARDPGNRFHDWVGEIDYEGPATFRWAGVNNLEVRGRGSLDRCNYRISGDVPGTIVGRLTNTGSNTQELIVSFLLQNSDYLRQADDPKCHSNGSERPNFFWGTKTFLGTSLQASYTLTLPIDISPSTGALDPIKNLSAGRLYFGETPAIPGTSEWLSQARSIHLAYQVHQGYQSPRPPLHTFDPR